MYICIILLFISFCIGCYISYIDIKRRIIPDVLLFPFLFLGLIINLYFNFFISIQESIISGFLSFLLCFTIGKLCEKYTKKDCIGFGDIKLISSGSVWLGSTGISLIMLISSFLAYLLQKKIGNKYIPFAPFFFISFLLTSIIIKYM